MRILNDYSALSVHGDCGLAGDCFELALHDYFGDKLAVSAIGVVDLKAKVTAKRFNKVEVKTGAGTVQHNLKGNSYVVYCPVVNLNGTLLEQEAFVLRRVDFIECLRRSGCYRESKTTSAGTKTEAIQTFWNRKLNKPHGKKLFDLLDQLYEWGTPIQEWLGE